MFMITVLTLCALCLVKGQYTDRTRVPNASGSDVVEAVANLIREACIFPNDKLYLRRLAYVETMDGMEVKTYRPNYYGGIWQVDQDMFDQISTAKALDNTKLMIKQQLAIDWSNVLWSDLLKPLYSGLAAALFSFLKAGPNGIPGGIEYQANFWVNTSRPKQQAGVFVTKANKLKTGCKRTNALDLVFALDSSTSLSPMEFEISKQFVASIVDSFEISPSKTQVGVLRFSTIVTGEFTLNQYTTSDAIKKAIEGVQYLSGGTHTDEAISYAVNNMFTPSSGARNGSSMVLIIVTDGRAENGIETVRVAADAKAKGITIFVIGVTQQVNEESIRELNSVASFPKCTHVKILNSFSDLDSLTAEIEQALCTAPAVLIPNTYVYGCNSTITVDILPNVKGGTTVTVLVDEGEVEVFGSLATSNLNSIINDFYSLATVTAPTSFFIKGDKQVALALISNKVSSCRSNFTVKVEEGQKARPNNHLLCIEDNIIQNCTAETLQKSPYLVITPGDQNYLGYCKNISEFFVFPERNDRFIYCCGQGHYFIVLCPLDGIFKVEFLRCFPEKLVLTTLTSTDITLTPLPTTVIPELNVCVSNPCRNGGTCTNYLTHYLCKCDIGYSGHNCQIGSYITDTPRIILDTSTNVNEGSDIVKIPCFAEGIPTPTILWELIDHKFPVNVKQLAHYLVIENVTTNDSGYYMCTANNSAGLDVKVIHIIVTAKPSEHHVAPIINAPSMVEVPFYADANLVCHVTGIPTPTVTWNFINNTIARTGENLVIHRVTNSSAGVYTCIATNDAGTSMAKILLKVTYDPSKIIYPPLPIITTAGQSHNFTCKATGHPTPQITWSFSSFLHPSSQLPPYVLFDNGTVITIVNMEESGVLSCSAQNEFGVDMASAHVIVKHSKLH